MVSFALNYEILMVGRALIGVAIGGFWSMSAATITRLVPEQSVPRGLAIIYGGNALASAIAAPLGSFMGGPRRLGGRLFFLSSFGFCNLSRAVLDTSPVPPADPIRDRRIAGPRL